MVSPDIGQAYMYMIHYYQSLHVYYNDDLYIKLLQSLH